MTYPSIDGPGGVVEFPRQGKEDTGHLDKLIKSGAWLNQQNFPPLQYAVEGLIPEGYGLLVAAPKIGKSWLCLSIILAVVQGTPALGGIPTQKRPVLYLALEDGDRRMKARCKAIMNGDRIPRDFEYTTEAVGTATILGLITRFQEIHPGEAPLIVLDTLAKATPAKAAGTSAYDHDYSFGAKLQSIAKSNPGSTVLAVHHDNKADHDDFMGSVSGTNGVTGACDFVMVLKRNRNSEKGILHTTGRDIDEDEYAMTKADNGGWSMDGGSLQAAADAAGEVKADEIQRAQLSKQGDRSNEILAVFRAEDFIKKFPNGAAPAGIADAVGVDNDTAGQYLRRLEKKQLIRKESRGTYYPLSELSEVSEPQVNGHRTR